MIFIQAPEKFTQWRLEARSLLNNEVPPKDICWSSEKTQTLFSKTIPPLISPTSFSVSKQFLNSAKRAALYRDPDKWNLLYRILWRLTHQDSELLKRATDPDIVQLHFFEKAIRRDIHKMHAFVRFQLLENENYVAWYEPSHLIVEAAAPFFVRRFGEMKWTIFTPDASACWDKEKLIIGAGVVKTPNVSDHVEDLWKDYYSSIFNPARVKIKAMKSEMPVKHWKTLPEASLIPELIRNAPKRVEIMIAKQIKNGVKQTETNGKSIFELKQLSKSCTACPLYKDATQTVFGDGKTNAKIIFIGEQPGDEEDIKGQPFVGPAGRLLDGALEKAQIDRNEIYITNAVKHFKFEQKGKIRLHKRPTGEEINACKFWLQAELENVNPDLVVCLGATAAQSYLGRAVKISDERGNFFRHGERMAFVTIHPSALLRMPDSASKEEAFNLFVSELCKIKNFIAAKD